MNAGLRALADLFEENGVRIAKMSITPQGVARDNAATAADCFTIAAGIRAASGTEAGTAETVEQGSVHEGPVAASETPTISRPATQKRGE